MQSKMLNSTLINNWSATNNSFNANISEVDKYNNYLFLRRELEVTADNWDNAKKQGLIRHCKVYKGKFLDYVVHKEFDTIQEWVSDAGGKMEDVLYGENRVKSQWVWNYDSDTHRHMRKPYKPKYVYLADLLNVLGYDGPVVDTRSDVEIPTTTTRDLTDMISLEMRMRGLTIDNVYVIAGSEVTSWKSFISH